LTFAWQSAIDGCGSRLPRIEVNLLLVSHPMLAMLGGGDDAAAEEDDE